jgi:hypothetical protein
MRGYRHWMALACAVAAIGAPAGHASAQEGGAASGEESSAASPMGELETIGHWVVTATDDGAGNFVNCTAFGIYGEEQLILSYMPQGSWEFGLWRPDWGLDTGGSYFLWYNVDAPVDGPGVMKRPVEAIEPERILFEVSSLETLIERASQGDQLNLQLRGLDVEPQSLSYSLDRAGEALQAAQECTRRNLEAAHTGESEASQGDGGSADAAGPGAVPALPPIGDRQIESFEVPGWQGGAYADTGGTFTHCSILASYQNGTVLGIGRMAGGAWLLALQRSDWTLSPGAWSPIRYALAGDVPLDIEGEAQAIDSSIIAVNMGRQAWLVDALRAAPELSVTTQDRQLVFDISDIGPGLDALQDCASRHASAAETAAAPDAAEAGETQAEAPIPGILEQTAVEDWTLAAFANDQDVFTHCAAYAVYQSGLELYLIQDDTRTWRFAMFGESWDRAPGTRQKLRYRVDEKPFVETEAFAPNPTTLFISPEGGNLDSIAAGRELVVEIEGERVLFDLGNADKAVPAVADCVERHLSRTPGAAATAPDAPDAAAANSGEEAQAFAKTLLEQAGYSEQDLLSPDEVPEYLQQYDAVWRIADVFGTLTVQPPADDVTIESLRDMLFASDAENCDGQLASGELAGPAEAGAALFFSRCEQPGGTIAVFYNLIPRPDGGYYIGTLIALGDAETAEAIGRRLHEAAGTP